MEKIPHDHEANSSSEAVNEAQEVPLNFEEHMQELAKTREQEAVQQERIKDRQYGAKVLSAVNFEVRHKEIVGSSFNKARERGDKLPGKNGERRDLAYVQRLEEIVNQFGPEGEKRLWEASAQKLIADNQKKHYIPEAVARKQAEGLKPWTDALSNSDRPMWFKVFAWDGLSKMGKFDSETKRFDKRQAGSKAPYPKFSQEALDKVYDLTTKTSNPAGINFSNMYSEALLSSIHTVKTPENSADVQGEWREYLPGSEEELAWAAINAPWCIKDSTTGRNYLETGFPGGSDKANPEKSKGKFILLHLSDPQLSITSDTACASIRLNPDGKVDEISGLRKEDQGLENSLLDEVERKVMQLPGGQKYEKAFADARKIGSIEQKTNDGQPLSKDDLSFLYGINGKIDSLNPTSDARIESLKSRHGIDELISSGVPINTILKKIDSCDMVKEVDALISQGVNIKKIVSNLDEGTIVENMDTLIARGAKINPNKLVRKLHRQGDDLSIVRNLDILIKNGATIDTNKLKSNLQEHEICDSFDILIRHGADIDLNRLAREYADHIVSDKLEDYIRSGGDTKVLLSSLSQSGLERNKRTLQKYGLIGAQ